MKRTMGTALLGVALLCAAARAGTPANDNFAGATALSGASFSVTASNVGATKETLEPDHASLTGGASVWFSWIAPNSVSVAFSTFGSDFDTLLAVYTGASVDLLTNIASGNNSSDGIILTSQANFFATAGTQYFIAVDGVAAAAGNIVLTLPVVPPANDNFAAAIPLSGVQVVVTGSNIGATLEAGEPLNPINSGGALSSAWWTWTAPATGKARVSTFGSDYDTITALYTGSDFTTLALVGSNDDGDVGLSDLLVFDAVQGAVYFIAIDGFSGQGSIRLVVGMGEGGANIDTAAPPVVNPLNGISIAVIASEGGLIIEDVNIDALIRAAFGVSTEFGGVRGVLGTREGNRPQQQFSNKGVFVSTHTATDLASGAVAGKARKTLVISAREVGENTGGVVDSRVSKAVALNKVSGKFLFVKDTPDQVAFTGTIELPTGLDLSQNQTFAIGMGNIVEEVEVTPKGGPLDKSKGVLGRIKKLKIKYPKLPKGETLTTAGLTASVSVTLSTADMDLKGFDTEGVTNTLKSDEAGLTTVPRSIQVAMVLGGVEYSSQIPVEFKLSTKGDAGQIRAIGPR